MNPETTRSSRLIPAIFYMLLATVVLAPLAFWPSAYFAIESVKTLVIGLLTSVSVILILILALKEKELRLPPKSMVWIGALLTLSMIISASLSGHFVKSFFGQGFELGAAGFLITLMLAGFVAFSVVARKTDKVIIIYTGLVAVFLILWIFQAVRLIAGPSFATLGILGSVTSSLIGGWFSFGIFSVIIALISALAIMLLPLSSKMKIAYWVLFGLAAVSTLVINSSQVWGAASLLFLALAIYISSQSPRMEGSKASVLFKRLAWMPVIVFVITSALYWYGFTILGPVVAKINAGYAEISLPWQMTVDVAAGELKTAPLFGAGPNRFAQAYIANKPSVINTTDAWAIEFNNGFGLVPTFLVTQGFVGGSLWVLLFIFFGILGVKSLKGFLKQDGTASSVPEAERSYAKFIMLSSYSGAAFIWLISLVYVPSHAIVYLAFVLTGIWLAASVAYGRLRPVVLASMQGGLSHRLVPIFEGALIVIALAWGFTYAKNSVALAYFGKGVKELTSIGQPDMADKHFATAVALNPLDIYWQGRAEANINIATRLASTVTATSSASTSAAVAKTASEIANKAMEYANAAVSSDKDNYNNYLSQARVGEFMTALRMTNGYENTVGAYTAAIQHNPANPSLYLSLAKLQANQGQLDAAIQTIGASLQVKSNYLDAVYLLSQVEAAKGNVQDAVTAAEFAITLNPQNPLLYFQLGLLEYARGNYEKALASFTGAVKFQPAYANAMYFQGLSYARVGNTTEAINTFQSLAQSNPDNQEIATILTTLRSGRSLFTAPAAVNAARPEKKATPPIKEN